MNELDIYYRALLEIDRLTEDSNGCTSLSSALARADAEGDKITSKRTLCTIEDDWIDAIEEGLVHIEKAIKEERQFITSNGEVVPIEKVKGVSKESVQHLAKHGNLITRVPEDNDHIIPDKLYTVERLNDYTVYENRFLYMLLCYLRDFITIRYDKILELTNRYDGALTVNKKVTVPKRTLDYSVTLTEVKKDDKYLAETNPCRARLDRIDLLLKATLAFLSTPLMEYQSKVAMIKPPITKTNVLKSNNNFKGALRLYEFIVAYDKPGYTVETKETTLSPFREDLAKDFAGVSALISFIAYEYGLGIKGDLKERYNREELRRKEEELLKKNEQLLLLGRKLKASGISPEEYALSLEKQLRATNAELSGLVTLRATAEEMREKIEALTLEVEEVKKSRAEQKAKYERMLEEQRAYYDERLAEQKEAYEKALREQKEHYENALTEMRERYEGELKEQKKYYESALTEQKEAYERQLDEQKEYYESELKSQAEDYENQLLERREYYEVQLEEQKNYYEDVARREETLHAEKVASLINEHESTMAKMCEGYEEQLSTISDRHDKLMGELEEKLAASEVSYEEKLRVGGEQMQLAEQRFAEKTEEAEALTARLELCEARIKGLLAEKGQMFGDFTDKKSFDALEREYNAFTRFYQSEWAKTKKQIRKNILNLKNLKGKGGSEKGRD